MSRTLPSLMRAIILTKAGPTLQSVPVPTLTSEDDVLIKIDTAAMNRRDFWITKGLYPGITFDGILGSDGAGVVVDALTRKDLIGKEVIIDPTFGWPAKNEIGPFEILGMKKGTFADFITISSKNVHPKPAHLSLAEAAALPLAGITAYRAVVTCGGVIAGSKVLVTGAGSGVALSAVQFATALGAEVYVSSSSQSKIDAAAKFGSKGGFIYTKEGWHKELLKTIPGGVDVVIDGGGGDNFGNLIQIAKMGGRIVCYGATAGNPKGLNLPVVFLKRISILGTSMGSSEEFAQMVEFVNVKKIVPVIDSVIPLEDYQTNFTRMEHSECMGKLVYQVSQASKI